MYPVQCGDLIRRVRQRAALETTSGVTTFGPTFMPDSEVTDNINTSISPWYDMVLGSTFAGQYQRAPWAITTTGVLTPYPLAPNFYRLISVDVFVVSTQPPISVTAQPYQEEQRNQFAYFMTQIWTPGMPIFYQIQGTGIAFRPLGNFNVQVNYYPTPPTLSSSTDVLDSVGGWEEWIVLDAAIKCALKDGQMDLIQMLNGLKAEQTARILAAAPNRDQGAPERIHVTRGLDWSEGDGADGWGF